MQIQITPLFLILAALIGLLVGLLVASLFSPRDSRSAEKSAPPDDLAKEGFAETVRLWYSPPGKKVITELDGDYYRDFLVLSPEQKSRVYKMIDLWSTWAGQTKTPTPQGLSETELTRNHPSSGQPDEPLTPMLPVLEESVLKVLKADENDGLGSIAEPEKPKTIAGQISLIIEGMLEGNPLKEKGIKLIENTHHGVDVWVGLEKFDGIDTIPYPEVQQLIREAVVKWERQSEIERGLVKK